MEANPGYWSDDDEVSDELRALQAEVRAIKSIAGIHDVLGLDWFADY
jgi:hypothetical protein